jgi:hypothetical protein
MISTERGTKQLVENCVSLDVRRWVRSGELQKGATFELRRYLPDGWHTVTVHPGQDAVRLEYPVGEKIRTFTIALDRTDCNLGGQRLWLLCPKCSARAAKLFIVNELVRCRPCGNLSYRSQRQSTECRLKTKEKFLWERLEWHFMVPPLMGKVRYKKVSAAWRKVRMKLRDIEGTKKAIDIERRGVDATDSAHRKRASAQGCAADNPEASGKIGQR